MNVDVRGSQIKLGNAIIDVGLSVSKAWWDARQQIVIVLFQHMASKAKRFSNLRAYRPDGALAWEATLPPGTGPDAFIDAKRVDDVIVAFTFSTFSCRIDPQNGKLLSATFTK